MKLNGQVLLSLFLVSIFGVSRAFVRIDLENWKFVNDRKKLLDTVSNSISEQGDRIEAFKKSFKGSRLEPKAPYLIIHLTEANRNLKVLSKASLLSTSFISSVCTYYKIAYNKITSLVSSGSNVTTVTINDEIRILGKVVKVTSKIAEVAEEFFKKTDDRINSIWAREVHIKDGLIELKDDMRHDPALKEMSEALIEGIDKIRSDMRNFFTADGDLTADIFGKTHAAQISIIEKAQNFLSGDRPSQDEIIKRSETITSVLRAISDTCVEANGDEDF